MSGNMHTKTDLILTALLLTVLLPFGVLGAGEGPNLAATKALFEAGKPFEQDIVVTAYYSPTVTAGAGVVYVTA
jgi:hypothetical protein